jgi:hypothetical protein
MVHRLGKTKHSLREVLDCKLEILFASIEESDHALNLHR